MIIGNSGSGKSTLAKRLGEITGLPVLHMDQFYWEPGWNMRSDEDMKCMVSAAIKKEKWIFDGNYSRGFEERSERSDVIVFLDISRWLCLFRVIRRAISSYGVTRDDMATDCPERFNRDFLKFLKFIYDYPTRSRPKALALVKNAPEQVRTHHLKNKMEVAAFLKSARMIN
ncbi:MAG: DNA topology modulation protein FlaR [Pseudomonadota bacterium]